MNSIYVSIKRNEHAQENSPGTYIAYHMAMAFMGRTIDEVKVKLAKYRVIGVYN